MSDTGVVNNVWIKLALVSLVSIVLIFTILWGVNIITGNHAFGNMNMGNGYQMNGMMNYQGQMNMQGNMSGSMNGGMQGGMGMMGGMMNGGMQGGMGMMGGMMNGMNMMGGMQGGMGMH